MKEFKRILLAEDDPQDAELTLNALGEHGLTNDIQIVHDGVETLDYLYHRGNFKDLSNGVPVLILLDLKMPRMGGIEVIKQLKSDANMRIIPIVVLTSSRDSKDLEECYKLGVNAYVVKPVKFSEFIESVKGIGLFWALINEPPPKTS